MRFVRLLIVFLALVGLTVGSVTGQTTTEKKEVEKPTEKVEAKPATKSHGQLPKYWKQLGLTDTQKEKVYEILSDYHAKHDALAKQIEDLKRKEEKDLEVVLTAEQKAKLKEIATSKVVGGK